MDVGFGVAGMIRRVGFHAGESIRIGPTTDAHLYSCGYRVLAPGGRYLFNVWDSHRYNPFGRIAHEVAGSFFPANPPQFYNVPFSYHQIDPIKQSLIDAGFSDLQIAVVRLEKKIPNVESFARGLVYGNPLIDQIRERGGVDPDRVVGGILEALHREFGADARMPLQAIVFSATKPQ